MSEQLPNGKYDIINDFTDELNLCGKRILPEKLIPKEEMILRITEENKKPVLLQRINGQWEAISQKVVFHILINQMEQDFHKHLGTKDHPAKRIRWMAHNYREFLRQTSQTQPKLNPGQIDTLLGLTTTSAITNYSRFIRFLVPDIKNISENSPLFYCSDWLEKPMWRPNIQENVLYPSISFDLSKLQTEIKWHFLGGLRRSYVLETLKQFPIKGIFLKQLFSKNQPIYPSNEFPLFKHFIGSIIDPTYAQYTVIDCDAQNNPRPAVEQIIRHFGQPDYIFRSSLKFNKFASYNEWGFHLYYLHKQPEYFIKTKIYKHLKSRYKVEIYPLASKPICLPFGKGSALLFKDFKPRKISFKDFLDDFNEKSCV